MSVIEPTAANEWTIFFVRVYKFWRKVRFLLCYIISAFRYNAVPWIWDSRRIEEEKTSLDEKALSKKKENIPRTLEISLQKGRCSNLVYSLLHHARFLSRWGTMRKRTGVADRTLLLTMFRWLIGDVFIHRNDFIISKVNFCLLCAFASNALRGLKSRRMSGADGSAHTHTPPDDADRHLMEAAGNAEQWRRPVLDVQMKNDLSWVDCASSHRRKLRCCTCYSWLSSDGKANLIESRLVQRWRISDF